MGWRNECGNIKRHFSSRNTGILYTGNIPALVSDRVLKIYTSSIRVLAKSEDIQVKNEITKFCVTAALPGTVRQHQNQTAAGQQRLRA